MENGPLRNRARKATTALVGGSVVGVGVLLLPLPGPGTAIIAAGLGILGKEFPAARRLLDRSLDVLHRVIRLRAPERRDDR
jgi:hypothetical protein